MFLIIAIARAKQCSNFSSDSRPIHFLFVTVSPVLYIIFSKVPNFCITQTKTQN